MAVLNFVCSVGNVPLAGVLWKRGRTAMMLRLTGIFNATMVAAAYVVEALSAFTGLTRDHATRPSRPVDLPGATEPGSTCYQGGVAVALVWRSWRNGGRKMLGMMGGTPDAAEPETRPARERITATRGSRAGRPRYQPSPLGGPGCRTAAPHGLRRGGALGPVSEPTLPQQHPGQLLGHQTVPGASIGKRVEEVHPQHAAEDVHVVGPVECAEDAPVEAGGGVLDRGLGGFQAPDASSYTARDPGRHTQVSSGVKP